MSDIPETGEKKGINRRSLIKRAAATGAVAWTAPVILDSMLSPAAAASCGVIYRVEVQMSVDCTATGVKSETVGGYAADSCYPNATSGKINIPGAYSVFTLVDVPKDTVAAGGALECVVLTASGTNTVKLKASDPAPAASCDSRLNNDVIATIASPCTPTTKSLSTCSGQKRFIAAGYNWRTSECGNFARTWNGSGVASNNSCGENSPTECNGRGSDGGTDSGSGYVNKTITSASSTSITFNQPASDKGPDHSGSYQFVIGCNCS